MANALKAAHEAGIVHRDIKPENVMVRPDGLVKVLDFGIAKLVEKPSPPESAARAVNQDPYLSKPTEALNETAPGIIIGTVTYMSPEQLRGQKVDARADIFSLGVVLYEVIAGTSPFAGDTQADRIAAILEREPAPLASSRPETPPELERIVSKALHKDRDARYQLVDDLLDDLKNLKGELEFQAKLGGPYPVDTPGSLNSAATIAVSIRRGRYNAGCADNVNHKDNPVGGQAAQARSFVDCRRDHRRDTCWRLLRLHPTLETPGRASLRLRSCHS